MTSSDPGPQPEPEATSPEPPPGGPDAVDDSGRNEHTIGHDLQPQVNPAADDLPDEAKEGEDTDTEATKNGKDVGPEDESPA